MVMVRVSAGSGPDQLVPWFSRQELRDLGPEGARLRCACQRRPQAAAGAAARLCLVVHPAAADSHAHAAAGAAGAHAVVVRAVRLPVPAAAARRLPGQGEHPLLASRPCSFWRAGSRSAGTVARHVSAAGRSLWTGGVLDVRALGVVQPCSAESPFEHDLAVVCGHTPLSFSLPQVLAVAPSMELEDLALVVQSFEGLQLRCATAEGGHPRRPCSSQRHKEAARC